LSVVKHHSQVSVLHPWKQLQFQLDTAPKSLTQLQSWLQLQLGPVLSISLTKDTHIILLT